MSWVLRFLDAQGEWIKNCFSTRNQIRLGVLMTDMGAVLVLLWPFVGRAEPPLIYQMSAFAILFAGIGTVITAVLAKQEEERDGDDSDAE